MSSTKEVIHAFHLRTVGASYTYALDDNPLEIADFFEKLAAELED